MNILTALFSSGLAVISGGDAVHGAELDPFFIFAIAAVLLLGEAFVSGKKKRSERSRQFEAND